MNLLTKIFILTVILSSTAFAQSEAETSAGQGNQYENLDAQHVNKIDMPAEDPVQMQEAFNKAYQNSSPEVQEAIRKASLELQSKSTESDQK